MRINVKVSPRASKNEIINITDDSLKVKLTAAPVDGAANEKLISLLAEKYDVAKNRIKIIRGVKSKNKIIEIEI